MRAPGLPPRCDVEEKCCAPRLPTLGSRYSRDGDFSRPCSGVAKTNPYTSRQAAALAFDEEQTDNYARSPASTRSRERSAARAGRLPFDEEEDESRVPLAGALPRVRRRAPVTQAAQGSRLWRFLLRTRIGLALSALALMALVVAGVLAYRQAVSFLEHDSHFRIDASSSIQIVGAGTQGGGELSASELLGVFGGDMGRNIFFVPLARRQAELEQVPWVAHAAVMRLLPNQLRVSLVERTPIAFVRLGSTIALVDADGVILHLSPAALASRHYSFPVVTGINPGDPPASRATRMHLYQRFVSELDASGQPVSSDLSEVDLADPEDVKAVVPAQGSDILLHFGDSDFLTRYRSYQAHLPEWRQQYPHLSAIDLRYDRQVVLKMADGAESEASSVDHGNSLTAVPGPEKPALAAHHHPIVAHPASSAHRPAGHGTAHGWRPL